MGIILMLSIPVMVLPQLNAADYVWIEGEKPVVKPAVPGYEMVALKARELTSGGRVLQIKTAVDKLKKPGLVFGYEFQLDKGGERELWVRIGHEWKRSPFQWRIDDGKWTEVDSLVPTLNLQDVKGTCLAWLKLTKTDLRKGKHRFQFKLSKGPSLSYGNKKGLSEAKVLLPIDNKTVLGMLDCIYIGSPGFVPKLPQLRIKSPLALNF